MVEPSHSRRPVPPEAKCMQYRRSSPWWSRSAVRIPHYPWVARCLPLATTDCRVNLISSLPNVPDDTDDGNDGLELPPGEYAARYRRGKGSDLDGHLILDWLNQILSTPSGYR